MKHIMKKNRNYYPMFLHEGETLLCRKKHCDSEHSISFNLDRDYRSRFGCSPVVCAMIWVQCRFMETNIKPKHLLWSLMFLKVYGTEKVMANSAGLSDRKIFRETIWPIIEKISSLQKNVVSYFLGNSSFICIFMYIYVYIY